jgi:hypothetical protein
VTTVTFTSVFVTSFALQALVIVFHGPFRLLISVGTLLRYLETGGVGAVVRPWVWILATGEQDTLVASELALMMTAAIGGNFLPLLTNNVYFYMAVCTRLSYYPISLSYCRAEH